MDHDTQQQILAAVVDGTLFGMIQCDVCVPEELLDYFSEMQPVFKNAGVTRDDIGPFMLSMPKNTTFSRNHALFLWVAFVVSRSCSPHHCYDGTSRMDSWWGRVYQIIEYEPIPCFRRLGESVSTARRAGDEDPDKPIIADTMKLLGNSGCGKTVTNVDRHRDVKYCTEIGTSALINNKRFRQRDVVTEHA